MISNSQTLGQDPSKWPAAPEDAVTITIPRKEAERMSCALADILCWMSGFEAGRAGHPEGDGDILSRDYLRKLNLKIKDAL